MKKSRRLFDVAKQYIPGGVNSPVRAFGSVSDTPRFIKSADGCYMTDVDGNKYIDYVCSWGPMILGHNNEKIRQNVSRAICDGLSFGAVTEIEVEMAQFICDNIAHIDMVRMVNSGTEAVMSAIRLARGYTKKDKIIKFIGCYHGHSDYMLVKAGSGAMTAGTPDSAGVTEGNAADTLTANYNDIDSVEELFIANRGQIAAVIIEPVAANMGVVLPKKDFLQKLRQLCDDNKTLLIFDEVITGFRLQFGGAAQQFDITPDLSVYGKIIGGGMPVGAYGGRREIMSLVAPLGSVYQAGTLSGNPIAMTAGLTQLKIIHEDENFYKKLNLRAGKFFNSIEILIKQYKMPLRCNYIGSIGTIFFSEEIVYDYESAKQTNTGKFADFFRYMLSNGVYTSPSQFEAMFISAAHKDAELETTLDSIENYFKSKQ
ncbi:MAG: glutamate-1-semialdehyde-2,1-aminomutase [Epulopiscium sp. Nuni2H_MBin003]|nr:MAG: glutamate-1-semialdehyde-2,1-aminomutase [Epulopiscium sp. Nuni2H_MBin003]